jgi:hypothetical protein
MNREDLTEIINLIAKTELEIIHSPNFSSIVDESDLLSRMGIASLEYMMMYLHIGELFGIANDKFQLSEMQGDIQLSRLLTFIDKYDTRGLSLAEVKAEYLDDR